MISFSSVSSSALPRFNALLSFSGFFSWMRFRCGERGGGGSRCHLLLIASFHNTPQRRGHDSRLMECSVFPSLRRPLVHHKISFLPEVERQFLLQQRYQALATPHPSCTASVVLQR